jgi:hypothetical protein
MSNPYIIFSNQQQPQQLTSGQNQQAADYQSALQNFVNTSNSPQIASYSNNNLMQLAQALRGKNTQDKTSILSDFWNQNVSPYLPWNQATPTDATEQQIQQLGSNSSNPLSDFNTGANGWGNYGE